MAWYWIEIAEVFAVESPENEITVLFIVWNEAKRCKWGCKSSWWDDTAWWEAPNKNPMLVAVFTVGEKLVKDRFLLPAIGSELNKLAI